VIVKRLIRCRRVRNHSNLYDDDHHVVSATQTWYNRTPVGVVLHLVALSIYFGWLAELAMTTSQLYHIVAVKCFCVVWNVGMYWLHSIQSLFLLRCVLSDVAIYHGFEPGASDQKLDLVLLVRVVHNLCDWIACQHQKIMIMSFATSYARPNIKKIIPKYCPVETNPDGSKYFTFLFRRYNFDVEKQCFVPGFFKSGKQLLWQWHVAHCSAKVHASWH
jgi:hypothetical protein